MLGQVLRLDLVRTRDALVAQVGEQVAQVAPVRVQRGGRQAGFDLQVLEELVAR